MYVTSRPRLLPIGMFWLKYTAHLVCLVKQWVNKSRFSVLPLPLFSCCFFPVFLVLLVSVSLRLVVRKGSFSVKVFFCVKLCVGLFFFFKVQVSEGWSYVTTPDTVGSIETPFACLPSCIYLLPVVCSMRKLERRQIARPLRNYSLLIYWANLKNAV